MKRSVAFVFHPRVARDLPEVAAARELLATRGIECWDVSREIAKRRLPAQLRRTGLIVTLGGDGTFLAGARLAAPRGIDVLGVNLGRLGFLTELEPGGLVGGLERYLNGEMRIEERSVLEVVLRRESKVVMRALAVNEVVVHRGADPRVIRLTIQVDGQEVGTFDADGSLVATPTGSTAYALALGGPIVEPTLRNMVLVPVNPFALTVRPMVFSPTIALQIGLARFRAELTIDGRKVGRRMLGGDQLVVAGFDQALRVVRFGPAESFFQQVRQKLGWGTPLVPQT